MSQERKNDCNEGDNESPCHGACSVMTACETTLVHPVLHIVPWFVEVGGSLSSSSPLSALA